MAAIHREFTPVEIETLGLLKPVELPVAEKLLEHCSERQLSKLGIDYTPAGDHVLIKPADSAVDKIVARLLKAATDEVQAEKAA